MKANRHGLPVLAAGGLRFTGVEPQNLGIRQEMARQDNRERPVRCVTWTCKRTALYVLRRGMVCPNCLAGAMVEEERSYHGRTIEFQ